MTFNDYQDFTATTAKYPHDIRFLYLALKLNGEAGEVAEKIGKVFRDKGGEFSDGDILAITTELGDVLWYIARLADEFGVSLASVAAGNIAKLKSRKERDTIGGSGDNR